MNSTQPNKLPSLEEMSRQYRVCVDVAIDSRALLSAVEELRRLALNTEVLAAKVDRGGKTLSVLSREVRHLTNDLKGALYSTETAASKLAQYAIIVAAAARICEKYLMAWEINPSGRSQHLILEARNQRGQILLNNLDKMRTQLRATQAMLLDLERLAVHIPVIATMLRIEGANQEDQIQVKLRSASHSLLELNVRLRNALEKLLFQVQSALKMSNDALHAQRVSKEIP